MSETDSTVDTSIDLTEPTAESGDPRPLVEELLSMRREVSRLGGLLHESQEEIARLRIELDLFSNTDLLTGFVNRNGLLEAIEQGIERFQRLQEPMSMLAIRIPELSTVEHGSEDRVQAVQHVGALVKAGLRRLDRVGRLEDDTLLMVLANLNRQDFDVVLQRIRVALTAAPIEIGEAMVDAHPITCSLTLDEIVAASDADFILERCLVGLAHEAGTHTPLIV